MTQRKTYSLLIIGALFFYNISAQEKYRAINWNTNDGLTWDRSNTMIKDKDGFIWITSEYGLNRFDGSRFTSYFPDKYKSGTIAAPPTYGIIEDSLHNLWFGTEKGLSRYDIKADTFMNFVAAGDSKDLKPYIIPFWASRSELYCIESLSRIIAYNIYTFEKRDLAKLESGLRRHAAKYSILDTVSNCVWMLPWNEDGLIQVSLSTGKETLYKRSLTKKQPHIAAQFNTETMRHDWRRNCIWINSQDGLIQFTLNNHQFHSTYSTVASVDNKEYEYWAGIDIDNIGRIWLATQSKGIIIYDPDSQTVIQPLLNPDMQKQVSEGNFYIYHDRDGIIWTSSWLKKGIHQLIPYQQSVIRYSSSELHPKNFMGHIPQIVPADHGQLWIGSQDGLVILDQHTGSIEVLHEKELPGIKGRQIFPMIIDTTIQKAWLSAYTPNDPAAPDAIYEMDIPTKKCRRVIFKDTANRVINPSNIVFYCALAYKNGFLFLDAGHGIFEVNRDSVVAYQVIAFPQNLWFIFLADSGKLVLPGVGTFSDNSGKWIRTPSPLDTMNLSGAYYDNANRSWWVGGFRKLIHFDKDFRIIHQYDEKAGLPELYVSHIIPDDFGNIWFNNDKGEISRLNPKTGEIIILSEKDGYKRQFFQWHPTFVRDAGGILYFEGQEGIDRIDPGKLNRFPPCSVYLLSLEVNQKPFRLQQGINNTMQLSLRYFENSITIETGVIDYYSKGKSRIRYKLEELDKHWEYAPAHYTIRLSKLPHGNYRLLIQASNGSNEFNGPVKSLVIHISPAFWNTWWFRIATVLFVAASLYSFIRWRLHQKFTLQLERSGKEKELAQLQQQKAELEMLALRAQMNPHFIFNSLNSINMFILENNRLQASEYLSKFSRLVRLILQNSQEAFIPLERELEALQLYLELESLRFDQKFEYKIAIADNVDLSMLKVPPLIIQPYVENAIWHGLMHKKDRGHLEIELHQQEEILFCKITDDGIGRNHAAELKSKSASTAKSMGMRITADRIAMLGSQKYDRASVSVVDLILPNGSSGGTEVLIKIPVHYD